MNPQGGPFRHGDRQFEFSPHDLDIAAKRGEIHINLPLDLRSRRVVDVEGGGDLRSRLAGDLPLFARALSEGRDVGRELPLLDILLNGSFPPLRAQIPPFSKRPLISWKLVARKYGCNREARGEYKT